MTTARFSFNVATWILVVSPPRERPNAASCAFFLAHQPHADGPARWSNPRTMPWLRRARLAATRPRSVARLRPPPIGETSYRHYASGPTLSAYRARDSPFAPPRLALPKNRDHPAAMVCR